MRNSNEDNQAVAALPAAAGAPVPRLERLRKRRDFLRVAAARRKEVTPGVIVQAAHRDRGGDAIGVGFTVTRKVGSAVVRNRVRRRLREAARAVLPSSGVAGMDYVLVGRAATLTRPFARLAADLDWALAALASDTTQRSPKR